MSKQIIRPGDPEPTEKQTESVIKWLSTGAALDTALAAAGVQKTMFHRWLRAGAEGLEPFATFASRVEAAKILFECKLLKAISDAADKGSLSAAQFLFNQKFGLKYKLEAEREAGLVNSLPTTQAPAKEISEEDIEAAERRALEAQKVVEGMPKKVLKFGLDEPKKIH